MASSFENSMVSDHAASVWFIAGVKQKGAGRECLTIGHILGDLDAYVYVCLITASRLLFPYYGEDCNTPFTHPG